MADTMSVRDVRAHLAAVLARAEAGDATVVTRGSTPVAAIVPMDAFNALEDAADELLAREAAQVLDAEGDGPTYTMSEIVADILGETPQGNAA
ncbi:type II toxin-antitoxin system Phd/YefM family antitoxin [Streptomyces sp. 6N223]|uniref:type II toxin-antitoxin system Phd/YefM family antitoxin n=1 Tax=Streptomyces sp. 6N223 TaxID=3457412 RepID=UPI003FD4CA9C